MATVLDSRSEDDSQGNAVTGSTFLEQVSLLCEKNWLLARRRLWQTGGQLLTPVAVIVLIVLFQLLANTVLNRNDTFPKRQAVPSLPVCTPGHSGECTTLLFAPETENTVQLLRQVAIDNGLVRPTPATVRDAVRCTSVCTGARADVLAVLVQSFEKDMKPLPGRYEGIRDPLQLANATSSNSTHCVVDNCDLLHLDTGECMPCSFVRDNATLAEYILANPNRTQNAVLFVGEYLPTQHPADSYILYYNYTIGIYPFFDDDHALSLKQSLDRASLTLATNGNRMSPANDTASLAVHWRHFPTPYPRIHGYDVMAQDGGTWLFLPAMITFFTILTEMVHEKESRLRVGMKTMGLKAPAFWVSWSIYGVAFSAATTLVMMAVGAAAGFDYFTNTNMFVNFLLFWLFGIATVALAFFLTTIINRSRTAQTVGYAMILLGFLFQSILSSGYGGLVDCLWMDNVATWVLAIRWIMTMYPAFNFSKVFYDISRLSSPTIDSQAGKVISGPGFGWQDLTIRREVQFLNFSILNPAPRDGILFLLMNAAIFMVLALYLDAVLPGPHGSPSHPLCCFGVGPHGGCCNRSRRRRRRLASSVSTPAVSRRQVSHDANLSSSSDASVNDSGAEPLLANCTPQEARQSLDAAAAEDIGVRETREDAMRGMERDDVAQVPAVRLVKLRKVYRQRSILSVLCHFLCGKMGTEEEEGVVEANDVEAVAGVSLVLQRNTTTAILGSNGAGKTSLISCLVGLFHSSSGLAEVLGWDVDEDISTVQQQMGVCPQHDILWPDLTAEEHLSLFARLKGVHGVGNVSRKAAVAEEVVARLHQVGLTSVGGELAGTFSGGMKRRLSVAISCIGNPSLIILDEPSTGLDPKNRRSLHKLIQGLRAPHRAVILTTHSMQEAETLADDVCIMAHGRMWAMDNPLNLKGRYGGGYRLSLSSRPAMTAPLLRELLRRLPGAQLTARDAGNIALAVPFSSVEDLIPTIRWIEGEAQEGSGGTEHGSPSDGDAAIVRGCVREWGVSLCTLEEVFLTVTSRANRIVDRVGAASAGQRPKPADEVEDDEEDDDGEDGGDVEDHAGLSLDGPNSGRDTSTEAGASPAVAPVHDKATRGGPYNAGASSREEVVVDFKPGQYGIRALWRKNLTLQFRQKGLCACQIVTPLLVMGFMLLLQAIIRKEFGARSVQLAPSVIAPLSGKPMDFGVPTATWERPDIGAWMVEAMRPEKVFGGSGEAFLSHGIPMSDSFRSQKEMHPLLEQPSDAGNSSSGADCLEFFLFTVNNQSLREEVGGLLSNGTGWGLLGSIAQSNCTLKNSSLIQVPYFLPRASAHEMNLEIYNDLTFLNRVNLDDLDNQPPCESPEKCPAYRTPDGTVEVHSLRAPDVAHVSRKRYRPSEFGLSFTLSVNDADITKYHRPNNFSRLGGDYLPSWVAEKAVIPQPARLSVVEMMVTAFASASNISRGGEPNATAVPWPFPLTRVPLSLKAAATMPEWNLQDLLAMVEVFGVVLYPMALTLQLPLFIFVTAVEKETQLLEMQKAMGLKESQYWTVNYLLNLSLYACVLVFFWGVGGILQFDFFRLTDWRLLLAFFSGWGFSVVSLGVFLAAFVSDRRVATVMGYVVALFGTLIGILLGAGIYGNIPPFSFGGAMPWPLLGFPLFALCRGVYVMNFACVFQKHCYTDASLVWGPGQEMRSIIIALFVDAVMYLLVGLYLEQVLPRKHGIRQHACFCLPRWCRPGPGAPRGQSTGKDPALSARHSPLQERLLESGGVPSGGMDADAHLFPYSSGTLDDVMQWRAEEDEDVTRERVKAARWGARMRRTQAEREDGGDSSPRASEIADIGSGNGNRFHEANDDDDESVLPLVAQNLRKEYPRGRNQAPVVALSDVSLAVKPGTTLGLLGSNGAGKSTCIGILTAAFPPTAGDAWVSGHHVAHEPTQVHLSLGLCPQHCRLWEDLTVEEHVLFYSRLKGVAPKDEARVVTRALRDVRLASVRHRRASALSGGMQRRLSVAISLCGDSRIVYLDEPSTGIDPASRRRLWSIIRRAQRQSKPVDAVSGRDDPQGSGQGRALVLVTHMTDEADLLCSEIAIMTHGRIRVLGSQQRLKQRFGGGYRVFVSFPTNDSDAQARAMQLVMRLFPTASVDAQFRGYVSFFVPHGSEGIGEMFQKMHEHHEEGGIIDWGVGQVTLEDVFAKVVRQYANEEDEEYEDE